MASGRCGTVTAEAPRLKMPAFSAAISGSVCPSTCMSDCKCHAKHCSTHYCDMHISDAYPSMARQPHAKHACPHLFAHTQHAHLVPCAILIPLLLLLLSTLNYIQSSTISHSEPSACFGLEKAATPTRTFAAQHLHVVKPEAGNAADGRRAHDICCIQAPAQADL